MTKLKELQLIQESIENQIENLREEASKNKPKKEDYLTTIHTTYKGMYIASVWKIIKGYETASKVTYNDIMHHKTSYTMELDEYCKVVQMYICKINEIEGY